jgi:hypothetical protein
MLPLFSSRTSQGGVSPFSKGADCRLFADRGADRGAAAAAMVHPPRTHAGREFSKLRNVSAYLPVMTSMHEFRRAWL